MNNSIAKSFKNRLKGIKRILIDTGVFPPGSDGKESAYNAGDLGSVPQ